MPFAVTLYQPPLTPVMVTAVPFDRDVRMLDEVFASLLRLTVEEQVILPEPTEKSVAVVPVR